MSDNSDDRVIKAVGALGTLERATEFQTFLLLANFVFALNFSLSVAHQKGLMNFSWEYAKENLPIGQALVFVMTFALYMSCVVGILRYFADQIVGLPAIKISSFFHEHFSEHDTSRYRRPADMVRPYDLLRAARVEGNDEYLEQYKEYENKRREGDAMAWRAASLSFALLVLLAVDAALPNPNSLSIEILHGLNSVYGHLGDFIAVLVIGVLLFSWLYRFIENDWPGKWIINPRLHEKLEAEEQRRRDEERRAMERSRI
ncbi:hypothetical protein KTF23_28490 [Burkholderia multivorans]|uniref:hypothetical protein n=1 Tax=Burkholderia multivorans TaxID=87883 RepID=UPI001C227939|nr:hypothetical protein [Burkholderia multivorans]MBU9693775.1 hypothetical protein [Burkholderia multivorans]